jgi:Uma2 family endonuclease
MSPHEIVLEETKPETEWVRGRALRKVSPTYSHGLVQRRISHALGAWAEAGRHGRVASEWRFRVTPPGEITRPLVPDVAYLSYAALASNAAREDIGVPRCAPTVAVEILSPDDRADDVSDKIRTYLAAGSAAVILIDPPRQTATVHHAAASREVRAPNSLTLPELPGFSIDLPTVFDESEA